jgi:hypothetical protein
MVKHGDSNQKVEILPAMHVLLRTYNYRVGILLSLIHMVRVLFNFWNRRHTLRFERTTIKVLCAY